MYSEGEGKGCCFVYRIPMQRSVSSAHSSHPHPPVHMPAPTSAHTRTPIPSNIPPYANARGAQSPPRARIQPTPVPPPVYHVNNLVRLRANISSRVSRDPRDSASGDSPRSRASVGHSSGGHSNSANQSNSLSRRASNHQLHFSGSTFSPHDGQRRHSAKSRPSYQHSLLLSIHHRTGSMPHLLSTGDLSQLLNAGDPDSLLSYRKSEGQPDASSARPIPSPDPFAGSSLGLYAVASPGPSAAVAKALASSLHMDEKDMDEYINRINQQRRGEIGGGKFNGQTESQGQSQGKGQGKVQGKVQGQDNRRTTKGESDDKIVGDVIEQKPGERIPSSPSMKILRPTDGLLVPTADTLPLKMGDELREAMTTTAAATVTVAVATITATTTITTITAAGGGAGSASAGGGGGAAAAIADATHVTAASTATATVTQQIDGGGGGSEGRNNADGSLPLSTEVFILPPASSPGHDSTKNRSFKKPKTRASSVPPNIDSELSNVSTTNSKRLRTPRRGTNDNDKSSSVHTDLSGNAVTGMDRKSFRVLVVDDSDMTRKMMMKTLKAEVTTKRTYFHHNALLYFQHNILHL